MKLFLNHTSNRVSVEKLENMLFSNRYLNAFSLSLVGKLYVLFVCLYLYKHFLSTSVSEGRSI